MTALIITGCIGMCYFFMTSTSIIKGADALLETLIEILGVLGLFILGGLIIGAMELLVLLFQTKFLTIFLTAIVLIAVVALAGPIFAFIGSILLLVVEVVAIVAMYILSIVMVCLEYLGNWSEQALKYFLGMINSKIALS